MLDAWDTRMMWGVPVQHSCESIMKTAPIKNSSRPSHSNIPLRLNYTERLQIFSFDTLSPPLSHYCRVQTTPQQLSLLAAFLFSCFPTIKGVQLSTCVLSTLEIEYKGKCGISTKYIPYCRIINKLSGIQIYNNGSNQGFTEWYNVKSTKSLKQDIHFHSFSILCTH